MTTAADDSAVEDAFEAFLAGGPVSEEGADVAAFAGAVQLRATRPGRPSAALAELLASGLLTDQPSPSARTARNRRRRRLAMFFPALLAKFLSAGALAQAATGAGVALVVVTGAGATGVLGDDVQSTISSVVGIAPEQPEDDGAVVAAQTPAATSTPTEVTTVPEATPSADPSPAAFDAVTWAAEGPTGDETFGEWVREAARAGKADGQVISHWARLKHVDLADVAELEGLEIEGLEDTATPSSSPTAETEQGGVDDSSPGRGNSGHGSSGGGKGDGGSSDGQSGSGGNGNGRGGRG